MEVPPRPDFRVSVDSAIASAPTLLLSPALWREVREIDWALSWVVSGWLGARRRGETDFLFFGGGEGGGGARSIMADHELEGVVGVGGGGGGG